MTIVFRFVVKNVHVAALVEPQTPDDDVVHGGRHLPPRVMIAAAFKSHVSDALICVDFDRYSKRENLWEVVISTHQFDPD